MDDAPRPVSDEMGGRTDSPAASAAGFPPPVVGLPASIGTAMMASTPPARTSDILQRSLGDGAGDRISIGELTDRLGERAFGILILLFALPNCIPGPPGVSSITGLPIIIFAIQIMAGSTRPWLPEFLRRRSFLRRDLLGIVTKADPHIRRLERLLRPRADWVFSTVGRRVMGVILLIVAVVLFLPIPLGGIFPAISIAVVALSLMERDGVLMIFGYFLSLFSSVLALTFTAALLAAVGEMLSRMFGG